MGCLVTSLIIYQSTPCNILEKQRLRIQSGRSLTSHMEVIDHIYTLFNFSLHAFVQYVLSCRTASFICISYKCKARVRHIFISPIIPEQHVGQGNSKTIPVQAQRFPDVWSSQISRQSAHESGKFVSLMHRPPLPPTFPPGNIPGTYFCQRLCRSQGRSTAGRIMSMKNSNDTIGNRKRELPACSAVCVGKHLIKIYLWPASFMSFKLCYSLILRVRCKEKYIQYRNVYRRNTWETVDARTVCWRRPDWGCSNCCKIRRKSCTCLWCRVLSVGYRQRTRDLWKERITLLCLTVFIVVVVIVKVFWVTWNWLTKV